MTHISSKREYVAMNKIWKVGFIRRIADSFLFFLCSGMVTPYPKVKLLSCVFKKKTLVLWVANLKLFINIGRHFKSKYYGELKAG